MDSKIKLEVTAYQIAQRFIGLREIVGPLHSPLVLAMLQLDTRWVADDETPWCSAFVNAIAWLLELPRSESLSARSWLQVGVSVPLTDAQLGFDVVVLSRGSNPTSGHVGFYAGQSHSTVMLLGGNQGNAVNVTTFDRARVLGVRRLERRQAPRPSTPLHV
jgi:uncharacterized protein (TIGR02594 family)